MHVVTFRSCVGPTRQLLALAPRPMPIMLSSSHMIDLCLLEKIFMAFPPGFTDEEIGRRISVASPIHPRPSLRPSIDQRSSEVYVERFCETGNDSNDDYK
jgi:hypothetical protein